MKAKYPLIIFFIALFSSCSPNENIVTFIGEETLSKEMTLSTMLDGHMLNSINSSTLVSLQDSEFFKQHLKSLIELKVTSIELLMSGYNNGLSNPEIRLGNTLIESGMNDSIQSIKVTSPNKLDQISQEMMQRHTLPLVFSGNCASADTFEVSVQITLKGEFVD